ncbi:MAG: glycosyl hydrolase family 65 protein [Candidatus Omnitrophota bacterium]
MRKEHQRRALEGRFNAGFKPLLHEHVKAWDNLWDTAEVSIWGDPEIEKNFRFNIYHMLICAPQYNGSSSIGAKAMTGEGYRGHVFWDTEIFLFPFYLYTFPEAARNMLLYRYKRLDAARNMAKENGYKGAMFPWESADSGRDETPDRARDLDGKVIKIHTGQMEHHITADIAYAFYHYYNVTQDEKFLKDYGYEVLFETARFWASRVEYNKRERKFEIKCVIGPDEFHIDVNNNAFTNMMAKWNLITAHKFFQKLKKTDPIIYKKLTAELGLTAKEVVSWRAIAAHICMNVSKQRIIEQFDGYFKKRYIKINDWDEHHLPIVSEKLTPRDYAKTQFVKQADVIMLLYLLSEVFNAKTKKRNYEYYISRTLHKSSLSLPMHALVAIDVGDRSRAYRFFHTALRTDISNIHDNTADGIHAACIGGVWQVLINGIVGLKIKKDILSLDPKLPREWRKLIFSLNYRHNLIHLEINNERIKIKLVPKNKKKLKINIFGKLHDLSGNRTFTFQRKIRRQELQSYY